MACVWSVCENCGNSEKGLKARKYEFTAKCEICQEIKVIFENEEKNEHD